MLRPFGLGLQGLELSLWLIRFTRFRGLVGFGV